MGCAVGWWVCFLKGGYCNSVVGLGSRELRQVVLRTLRLRYYQHALDGIDAMADDAFKTPTRYGAECTSHSSLVHLLTMFSSSISCSVTSNKFHHSVLLITGKSRGCLETTTAEIDQDRTCMSNRPARAPPTTETPFASIPVPKP